MLRVAPGTQASAVLTLEVSFPICRSEVVAAGGRVDELRNVLDDVLTGRADWDEAATGIQGQSVTGLGAGGRLVIETLQNPRAATLDRLRRAVEDALPSDVGTITLPGDEPELARVRRRLDETIDFVQQPGVDMNEVRVQASLLGSAIEYLIFESQMLSAGPAVVGVIDLEAARRLLPWVERLDTRDRGRRADALRDAISVTRAAVARRAEWPDAKQMDRRLRSQFIDTRRYPDGDWTAWLASGAVDAVYAAIGGVLGKRRFPPAPSIARGVSVDRAAISRSLVPWDLERRLTTSCDQPVIDELTAQLADLARARSDLDSFV